MNIITDTTFDILVVMAEKALSLQNYEKKDTRYLMIAVCNLAQ